jgi:quercetin dioxygenase-like cupin family protein
MGSLTRFVLLAWLTITSSVAAQTTTCRVLVPDAEDAVKASPANHTVLFEDEDVRVLDVHSQPHTREAVHTHRLPSVMLVLQQGAGTYDTPDGSDHREHPTDPNFKPRIFAIKSEGPHWTENTGEVPFHAIRVEFKHPGCGLHSWKPESPGPDDALVAAPSSHALMFENADVRVLDVHIAPHAKDPYHTHPWDGFFYVAQAAPVEDRMKGSGAAGVSTFPAGVVLPAEAQGHTIENVGDLPLHLIWFELKFATPGPEHKGTR